MTAELSPLEEDASDDTEEPVSFDFDELFDFLN